VIEMPTSDEIDRSVKEADALRTAKRSEVCTRVAELAEQRAAQAEQLAETERELGEVLADGGEVITIDEVARFTGVSATELDQWLAGRKTMRGSGSVRQVPGAAGNTTRITTRPPSRPRRMSRRRRPANQPTLPMGMSASSTTATSPKPPTLRPASPSLVGPPTIDLRPPPV
jgi:hypothetical protein